MKIWVIGRSYPMPINRMQGSFELEQAKMLAKHGHNVSYISCVFHPYKRIKKWGFCTWEEDNVQIYANSKFYAPERLKFHFEKYKEYIWAKFLNKVEKSDGIPDIIHIHYPSQITVPATILKYKNNNTKIICTEHWSQVLNKEIDQYEINQLRKYVDNSNYFFSVGEELKKSIYDLTGTSNNIFIIENIVNDVFQPLSKNKNNDIFKFISVGNQVKLKNFDKIILAFEKLNRINSNIKLTLVGNGPEHKKLINIANNSEISNKITFTGVLNRQDTANQVAKSDALICFSDYETFGVPIIESWACGNPVIISDSLKILKNWDSKLGLITKKYDEDMLAYTMKQMMENYKYYDRKYIRKFAMERYSEDSVYNKLMEYYLK